MGFWQGGPRMRSCASGTGSFWARLVLELGAGKARLNSPWPPCRLQQGPPTPRAGVGLRLQPYYHPSQGLCLRHGRLPVHADHRPLSLHCPEEAAPGDVGRCKGPPCV